MAKQTPKPPVGSSGRSANTNTGAARSRSKPQREEEGRNQSEGRFEVSKSQRRETRPGESRDVLRNKSRDGLENKSRDGLQNKSGNGSRQNGKPQSQSEPKPPFPKRKLAKPGIESELKPRPRYEASRYKPANKLEGKVALITGGDSGIGRAVAVLYAREGADVAITHLPEEESDADETTRAVQAEGRRCLRIAGDLADPKFCRSVVQETVDVLGKLDILVSNAAHQNRKDNIEEITEEEWRKTFAVNIDAYFHLTKAAVPHMKPGSAIIATSSVVGILGSKALLDYGATKGAINAFTKSLAQMLIDKGIRANVVAPGPVWTPLNPADEGASPEKISKFGQDVPMKRPAQPEELAPAFVFLASDPDSSYITGEILTVMGGETVGG